MTTPYELRSSRVSYPSYLGMKSDAKLKKLGFDMTELQELGSSMAEPK